MISIKNKIFLRNIVDQNKNFKKFKNIVRNFSFLDIFEKKAYLKKKSPIYFKNFKSLDKYTYVNLVAFTP